MKTLRAFCARRAIGIAAAPTSSTAAYRSNRPSRAIAANTAAAAAAYTRALPSTRRHTAHDHSHATTIARTSAGVTTPAIGDSARSIPFGGVSVNRAASHASRPFHSGANRQSSPENVLRS